MPTDDMPGIEIEQLGPYGDAEVIERIDLRTLKPLYDLNHDHQYAPDPDDETEEYQAMMCTVKGCNYGYLAAK